MRSRAAHFVAAAAIVTLSAGLAARADEGAKPPGPEAKPDAQTAPAPRTPAEIRAELYVRLAASKDSDETEGLVNLLLASYTQSGSDTADLLLQRARKAMQEKDYGDASKILDATIALLPDWAEGWNARATLRWLDDDYDGSMADIAETLKREPRHIGALSGMAMILEERDKREDALKVYGRVLAIAPHWRSAEDAEKKLRAALAGQEL
jgi:tetratricopeptide (TPR) repeat protein